MGAAAWCSSPVMRDALGPMIPALMASCCAAMDPYPVCCWILHAAPAEVAMSHPITHIACCYHTHGVLRLLPLRPSTCFAWHSTDTPGMLPACPRPLPPRAIQRRAAAAQTLTAARTRTRTQTQTQTASLTRTLTATATLTLSLTAMTATTARTRMMRRRGSSTRRARGGSRWGRA